MPNECMIARTKISVRSLQRKRPLDLAELQQFAERALAAVRQTSTRRSVPAQLPEIDILLIADRRMAQLHQRFMNTEGPTDVLTFQHGEIFVSVETAERNARRFRTSPQHEIELYIVHGLLHLHGFDDRTATKSPAMNAAQARIMQELTRDG